MFRYWLLPMNERPADMVEVARTWRPKALDGVGVNAKPKAVTTPAAMVGVAVNVVNPGIDGIEGGLLSCVVTQMLARCLLHETKSCWPVGWYVVPSFDFKVTVRPR